MPSCLGATALLIMDRMFDIEVKSMENFKVMRENLDFVFAGRRRNFLEVDGIGFVGRDGSADEDWRDVVVDRAVMVCLLKVDEWVGVDLLKGLVTEA
ncbi:hypothetical protein PGB90_009554 [Kerria lacca]